MNPPGSLARLACRPQGIRELEQRCMQQEQQLQEREQELREIQHLGFSLSPFFCFSYLHSFIL